MTGTRIAHRGITGKCKIRVAPRSAASMQGLSPSHRLPLTKLSKRTGLGSIEVRLDQATWTADAKTVPPENIEESLVM